eukprot:15264360-Ditylum_brightwellii.AAC.1
MLETDGVQYMSLSITESKKHCNGNDLDKVHPIAILLIWHIPLNDTSISLGAEIPYITVEDCCPKTL